MDGGYSLGKIATTDQIAEAEQLAEGKIQFHLPLAFLSPRVTTAIANDTAPSELNVSKLTPALPDPCAEQECNLLRA